MQRDRFHGHNEDALNALNLQSENITPEDLQTQRGAVKTRGRLDGHPFFFFISDRIRRSYALYEQAVAARVDVAAGEEVLFAFLKDSDVAMLYKRMVIHGARSAHELYYAPTITSTQSTGIICSPECWPTAMQLLTNWRR